MLETPNISPICQVVSLKNDKKNNEDWSKSLRGDPTEETFFGLNHLNISHNKFQDDSVIMLVTALESDFHLRTLDFSHNLL